MNGLGQNVLEKDDLYLKGDLLAVGWSLEVQYIPYMQEYSDVYIIQCMHFVECFLFSLSL